MIIPINFLSKYKFEDKTIEYKNLNEMVQGGPELGKLFIDEKPILSERYFGGPLIIEEHLGKMIVPVLHRSIFKSKFKIAVIDLNTNECRLLDKKENLILLKSVSKEGVISYYNNLENTNLKTIDF